MAAELLSRIPRRHLVLAGVFVLACLCAVVLHPFLRDSESTQTKPVDIEAQARVAVLAQAKGQRVEVLESVFARFIPTGKTTRKRFVFAGKGPGSKEVGLFLAQIKVGTKGQIYSIDGPTPIVTPVAGRSVGTVLSQGTQVVYAATDAAGVAEVGVVDLAHTGQPGDSPARAKARRPGAHIFDIKPPAPTVKLLILPSGAVEVTAPKLGVGRIGADGVPNVSWLSAVSTKAPSVLTGQKDGTEDGEGTPAPEPDAGLVFEAVALDEDAGVADAAPTAPTGDADAGVAPPDAAPVAEPVQDAGAPVANDGGTDGGSDGGPDAPAPIVREGWMTRPPEAPAMTAPSRLAPVVSPPLPGEGAWTTRGLKVESKESVFYQTFFRPNPKLPSIRADIVLMDPRRVDLNIAGGTDYPPSPIYRDGKVPRVLRNQTVAAFNGFYDTKNAELGLAVSRKLITSIRPGTFTIATDMAGGLSMSYWPEIRRLPATVNSARQTRRPVVVEGRVSGALAGQKSRSMRTAFGSARSGYWLYVVCARCDGTDLGRALLAADAATAVELTADNNSAGFEYWEARNGAIRTTPLLEEWQRSRYTWARRSDFFYLTRKPRVNARVDAFTFSKPLTPVPSFVALEKASKGDDTVYLFHGRSTRFAPVSTVSVLPGCLLTIQKPPGMLADRAMVARLDPRGVFDMSPAVEGDIEWLYPAATRYGRASVTASSSGWALGADGLGNLVLVHSKTAEDAGALAGELGVRHAIDPVRKGASPRLVCGDEVVIDGDPGAEGRAIGVYAVRHPTDWRITSRIER